MAPPGALSGTNTNFNTSVSSGVNTNQTPGASTDVIFVTSTPAATNLATTLDQDFTVKSVTVIRRPARFRSTARAS